MIKIGKRWFDDRCGPRCFSEARVAYQFRVLPRGDRDGGFGRDGLLWRGESNRLEVDTSWAGHFERLESLGYQYGVSVST